MKKRYLFLMISLGSILLLVLFGTWFFAYSEHWRTLDAFYFTIMTITTVGYGDFVPRHDLSKLVTAIYSMISIPIVLFVFGVIAENYFETRMRGLEKRLFSIMTEEKEIEDAIDETEHRLEKNEAQ